MFRLIRILPLLFFCILAFSKTIAQKPRIIIDTSTTLVDALKPPFNRLQPGDTIYFQAGTRSFLLIRNFQGQPGKPFIFSNLNGEVIIKTDHYYGISVLNCRYIRFTGTGDRNCFYGFKIQRVKTGPGFTVGGLSSDFEIDHIFIENAPIAGLYAKTDPDCSFASTREKFTQFNTIIHDNYISNAGNEGMYIGSSKYGGQKVKCNGRDTVLLPSLLEGVKVYNNIITHSGWDGIQVSSASANCQVFGNLILFDSQAEEWWQMSGILLGAASKCDCYNNFIAGGKGNGIENHGFGGSYMFNNIIVDAGRSFFPSDLEKRKYGIYVTDVSAQKDSSFFIIFNDIINPKSEGIRFSSIKTRGNIIASNAIINPGNFDYYENGNTKLKGKDSYILLFDAKSDVSIKDNYFSRRLSNAAFTGNYYKLLPNSPLVGAGYPDSFGISYDYFHNPRKHGKRTDVGAVEYFPEDKQSLKSLADLPVAFTNPVTNQLKVQFRVSAVSDVKLYIYNLEGSLLQTENKGITNPGEHEISVGASKFTNGIYLFSLFIGKELLSGRFVVDK